MSEKREIVVDVNNKVIGAKFWCDMTDDDFYRVSSLWVVIPNGAKYDVLIAQRKLTKKKNPGKWGPSVAGTIEEGETYEENIIKEAREEIGLTDIKIAPINEVPLRRGCTCRHFTMTYITIGNWKLSDFTPQESEVENLDIVPIDDLLSDTSINPEKYLPNFHSKVVELNEYLENRK